MRYAPDHKLKTRARILEAAGRVFRSQGYQRTGVDKVMEEAGLTAGGFYAHFSSKQELFAETLEHTREEMGARHEAGLRDMNGREWVDAFLARYLGTKHRQEAENCCPLVALISEVSRADGQVKQSFEAIVRELSARLGANAQDAPGSVDERALAAVALCVGGLGLARSVHDEALAEQILESCRNQAAIFLCGRSDSSGSAGRRRKLKNS
jgi:TetR/AcrR family transcriptional regulator, transcriptional repressor for nem operon